LGRFKTGCSDCDSIRGNQVAAKKRKQIFFKDAIGAYGQSVFRSDFRTYEMFREASISFGGFLLFNGGINVA
jgi:hypothetical protein